MPIRANPVGEILLNIVTSLQSLSLGKHALSALYMAGEARAVRTAA
jgi:hypothetical protein